MRSICRRSDTYALCNAVLSYRSQRGGVKLTILLVVLGVLVLGGGYVAAQWFGIPKKLGIGVTAYNVLGAAPDRAAAAQLQTSFQRAGYNTKGTELYILPEAGTDKQMAVLVLDDSKGDYLLATKSPGRGSVAPSCGTFYPFMLSLSNP